MRILDGETCRRVYSYLRLDRAPHKCDEGFGIGVLAPGWDPMSAACGVQSGDAFTPNRIPGCQLFACTDTSAFPLAVVWPVITTGDDNMEAAGTAAYTATNGTAAKIGGAHSGEQCIEVTTTVVNGNICTATTATYVTGNCMRCQGWAASSDGGTKPSIYENGVMLWEGTASTLWQAFDTGWYTVTGPLRFYSIGGAGSASRWDDMSWSTLNVSQLTDLSGAGHHLLQATASKQPLWVASGSGGLLRFDGTSDCMKAAAFALNQPEHIFVLAKYPASVGETSLWDGNSNLSMAIDTYGGVGYTILFAGAALPFAGVSGSDGIYEGVYNGAASGCAINGSALSIGDAGASNGGGFTLCSWADQLNAKAAADVYAVVVYDSALSEANRQRVVRYLRRLGARLGVVIP